MRLMAYPKPGVPPGPAHQADKHQGDRARLRHGCCSHQRQASRGLAIGEDGGQPDEVRGGRVDRVAALEIDLAPAGDDVCSVNEQVPQTPLRIGQIDRGDPIRAKRLVEDPTGGVHAPGRWGPGHW